MPFSLHKCVTRWRPGRGRKRRAAQRKGLEHSQEHLNNGTCVRCGPGQHLNNCARTQENLHGCTPEHLNNCTPEHLYNCACVQYGPGQHLNNCTRTRLNLGACACGPGEHPDNCTQIPEILNNCSSVWRGFCRHLNNCTCGQLECGQHLNNRTPCRQCMFRDNSQVRVIRLALSQDKCQCYC